MSGRTTRVLVIEDNPSDARFTTEMLADAAGLDAEVTVASTLARSLDLLKDETFDVVLLDLGLPDANGFEGLAALRSPAEEVPVVILTGNTDEDLASNMIEQGAQDYIPKNRLSPAALKRSISNAIERQSLLTRIELQARQLKEEEKSVREIVSNQTDAILIVGVDGGVKFLNPASEKLFGRPAAEIYAEPFGLPLVIGEDLEIDIIRPTGTAVAEMRVVVTKWMGQPVHLVSLRDVTERKSAENRLRESRDDLKRRNRELDDFASVAAHDLQEPLRKVQMFSDRLADRLGSKLTEKDRDYMERMLNAAGRMRSLIDDLLSYSRITTGDKSSLVSVDLGKEAALVVSDIGHTIAEAQAEVAVTDLPVIEGEPTQLRQLLQNLICNAIKFHRPEVAPVVTVRGRVFRGGHDETAELCELVVEDNGVGFDEQHLDRIFKVFERLHPRHEYAGSGIGLATCRKIAERHRGTITATSTPGEGSTFIVTLPVHQPTEKDTDSQHASGSRDGPVLADDAPIGDELGAATVEDTDHTDTIRLTAGPGKNEAVVIVVADDDPDDLQMTMDALKEAHVTDAVHAVSDGLQLLEYLAGGAAATDSYPAPRPDLILLDLNMPRLDGFEALERIKADAHLRLIPVVVLTTSTAERDIQRAYECGAAGFISKPSTFPQLVETMSALGGYWRDIVSLPAP